MTANFLRKKLKPSKSRLHKIIGWNIDEEGIILFSSEFNKIKSKLLHNFSTLNQHTDGKLLSDEKLVNLSLNINIFSKHAIR
jgi:hypothetical protein